MVFEKETNLYADAALASRFQAVETQFSVVQGKINYLITDTEIAHYDDSHGTITNRMNSAENTVSEHTSQISSIQSNISDINGDITSFKSEVNTFKQTTNSTISQISSTVATKNRMWTTQPSPPYAANDTWVRDKTLYICTVTRSSGNYVASDWQPATKGRVFTSTPTVPYYAGDVWMQGANGDIKYCTTSRTSGSYSASDWANASKYTNDSALQTWIDGTYASDKSTLTNQIDGKIETFSQSSDPSTGWNTEQKAKHVGDLWYNTTQSVQKYYRWTGSAWTEITATPPSEVTTVINSKANIFTGPTRPSPPYKIGDLWFNATADNTGDIYTCVTTRTSGSGQSSDWKIRNKYTDDSYITNWLTNTYASDKSTLENQIDGKIETFSQTSDPSSAWTTSALKTKHTGDLWYNTNSDSQKYYRWTGSAWSEITADPPTSVANVISAKANIFTGSSTPSNPKEGDLWFKSATDDIKTYVNGSWVKYNKYTDDSGLQSWITNTYADDKATLQSQIDGKIETWSQTSDPSSAWTTTTLKNQHIGDLWYNTTSNVQKYYRWTGSTWLEITATPPTAVTNTISNKANIFTGSSTPYSPKSGDLWFKGTNQPILTYVNGSWQEYNKYTDDSTFTYWETNTYDSFIEQLPSQINLQVTGSGTTKGYEKFAAKAQIIAAINNVTQESEVSINADKIKITGNQGVVAAINGSTATIAAERIELKGNLIVNAINNGTAQISASKIELSSYPTTTDMNTALSEKNGIYRGSSIPTTSNYPASSWDTDAKKQKHIADVYIRSNGDQYQYVQGREGLLITFNPKCATESTSYDYVEIYYKIGDTTYKTTKYGGKDSSNNIANAKVFIPSNIFWLYWHTDTSVNNFYGFSIDEIKREFSDDYSTSTGTIPSYTVTEISGSTYPESSHNPYENSDNKLWKYTYNSSFSSDEKYGWAIRESSNSVTGASLTVLGTEISAKVSAGDIASAINQTAQSVRIQASKIDLDGYATFTSLSTQGQTTINGSNITTGTLSADRVMGGTFKVGGSSGSSVGNQGKIELYNSSNTRIGLWNNDGLYFGNIASSVTSPNFRVDASGYMTAKGAKLTSASGSYGTCTIENGAMSFYNTSNTKIATVDLHDGFFVGAYSNSVRLALANPSFSGVPSIDINSDGSILLHALSGKAVNCTTSNTSGEVVVSANTMRFTNIQNGRLYFTYGGVNFSVAVV